MSICPECDSPLCSYQSRGFTETICWNCGYYDSNSPAFKKNPELFKNMIRDNPIYYLKIYNEQSVADESLHERRNRRRLDGTIPHKTYILQQTKLLRRREKDFESKSPHNNCVLNTVTLGKQRSIHQDRTSPNNNNVS